MTAKMFNPANQLSVVGLPQCPRKYRDHKPIGKISPKSALKNTSLQFRTSIFSSAFQRQKWKKKTNSVGVEGGYERKNKIHVESLSSQTINTPYLF